MDSGFIKWLYTSLEGRLRRKHYWLGFVALILVAWMVGILLSNIIGVRPAQILVNIAAFALLAPLVAKRLHDRGRPIMPLTAVFLGVPLLLNLAQYLGIGFYEVELSAAERAALEAAGGLPDGPIMAPDLLGIVITGIGLGVAVWALVELGFLRGTVGPNAYGPDPTQETAS